MIQEIVRDMKLHKKDIMLLWLMILLGFAVGFGMLYLIMLLDETTTEWAPLGTLMALVFATGIMLFTGVLGYRQEFAVALSMGRRRKDFMAAYALRKTVWALAAYGMVLALCQFETVLAGLMFGGKPLTEDISVSFLLEWQFLVLWVLVLVLVCMFLGALYCRFGKPFGVVLYFLWIGGCIMLPNMVDEATWLGAAFGWFGALPGLVQAGIGVSAAGAMAVTVVVLGRKQMVR